MASFGENIGEGGQFTVWPEPISTNSPRRKPERHTSGPPSTSHDSTMVRACDSGGQRRRSPSNRQAQRRVPPIFGDCRRPNRRTRGNAAPLLARPRQLRSYREAAPTAVIDSATGESRHRVLRRTALPAQIPARCACGARTSRSRTGTRLPRRRHRAGSPCSSAARQAPPER